jgi:hypothetical protein
MIPGTFTQWNCDCRKTITTSAKITKNASRKLEGCPKDVQRMTRGCPEDVQRMSRGCSFQAKNNKFVPAILHSYDLFNHYKQVSTAMNYDNRCSFSAMIRYCNNSAFNCG